MHLRRGGLVVVGGIAAVVVAGCSWMSSPAPEDVESSPVAVAPPVGYRVPSNVRFSEHWVSTPAVDLMSPEGTYIRAYIEGDHIADFNRGKAEGSYPGFAKAAEDRGGYPFTGTGLISTGFHTNWVHEFDSVPDGSATAVVCYAANVTLNGTFPKNYTIFKRTFVFQRVGVAPPKNQRGPGRAPLVSVFGDWYTTSFKTHPFMDPECVADAIPVDKSPGATPGWPDAPPV